MKNKRYVVVTHKGGDFPTPDFDAWVLREFKHFKIEESGSGYGFSGRDITGVAPTDEVASDARQYFQLFPYIRCTLFELLD